MINLPWWASIPKAELRAIQEQKIFKKGEYPKLDAIMEELEAQKDNLINDLVGHLNPEWSMDKKLQWILDNKAVPVMSRENMGHHSGNPDKKPAKLDAWQNVYLKYQPPATSYADKEGEKARPQYPTANAILKKYEEVVKNIVTDADLDMIDFPLIAVSFNVEKLSQLLNPALVEKLNITDEDEESVSGAPFDLESPLIHDRSGTVKKEDE